MNILKKTHCGKISTYEKETLTYNIGNSDSDYYFAITDNASSGYFSHEWISLNVFGMGLSQKAICDHLLSLLPLTHSSKGCLYYKLACP